MTILPVSYLPSVEYFYHLDRGDCVIDLGEHYIKRSERNRARILATDGVMDLSVQLCNANRPRQRVADMHIDYSKRWQHQHWGAICSSYKSSPFFDFYAEAFAGFYTRRFELLADYDLELLACMCRLTGVAMPRVSEEYITAGPGDLDLRPKRKEGPTIHVEPYIQVFSDRFDFVPNLSFADLLFAEGPESVSLLRRCRPK